jgi:hypothetical protein
MLQTFWIQKCDFIRKNRKTCKTIYKCLQPVIEHKDFATIFDSFHTEYFRTRLLFHDSYVQVCTLEVGIRLFRLSMYMAKEHLLLHTFNEIINRIFKAGLYEKWQNDFLSSWRLDYYTIDEDDTKFSYFATNKLKPNYSPISIFHLQVVFLILLIGHISSTFSFLLEVLL